MEDKQTTLWEYCRFCAELMNSLKLMNIEHNQLSEVYEKLNCVNLELYADINGKNLPKKICHVCWFKFNAVYEFCVTFRKAQERFRELELENNSNTITESKNEGVSLIIDVKHCENDPKQEEDDQEHDPKPVEEQDDQEDVPKDEDSDEDEPLINFRSKLDPIKGELLSNINRLEVNIENKICDMKSWLDYAWSCKICRALLPDMDSLREHSKAEHKLCPEFVCIDCEKNKFMTFNKFVSHTRTHRKYLKNICIYCNKFSETPRKHFHSHYRPPYRQCETCGEIFANKKLLMQHQLMYNPVVEQKLSVGLNTEVSDKIEKKLNNKSSLKAEPLNGECEINIDIKPESSAISDNNNQELYLKDSRKNRPVSPKPKRKYKYKTIYRQRNRLRISELTCNECQTIFTTKNKLLYHKQNVHGIDDRPDLVCDQCAKIFKTENGLKLHIENHDKKKKYQCKLCTKTFSQKSFLKTHVKAHLGIKPFKCDQCQKGFTGRSFLTQHIKSAHGANDAFPCQYCPKKFKHRNNWKNHEITHTGDKPFVCPECGMRFNNYANCLRHSIRRHNKNLSKGKYTEAGYIPIDPSTGKVVELVDDADWTKDVLTKKYKRDRKKRE